MVHYMQGSRLGEGGLEMEEERAAAERIIRRLRFPYMRRGTECMMRALMLCCQDPGALGAVTKEVYREVAGQLGTDWRNVEHNLRSMRDGLWRSGNRALLNEMVGFELLVKPSVGELLYYIVAYLLNGPPEA